MQNVMPGRVDRQDGTGRARLDVDRPRAGQPRRVPVSEQAIRARDPTPCAERRSAVLAIGEVAVDTGVLRDAVADCGARPAPLLDDDRERRDDRDGGGSLRRPELVLERVRGIERQRTGNFAGDAQRAAERPVARGEAGRLVDRAHRRAADVVEERVEAGDLLARRDQDQGFFAIAPRRHPVGIAARRHLVPGQDRADRHHRGPSLHGRRYGLRLTGSRTEYSSPSGGVARS